MNATDFATAITNARSAADCERIEAQLQTLLTQVNLRKRTFEERDRQDGLQFTGQGAFICDCGNSVREGGDYIGSCGDCKEAFCTDCLLTCDKCEKYLCCEKEEPCAKWCEGCEDKTLCYNCLEECNYCQEKKCCEDCLQDTTAPFENLVCPDCFDYLKYS